MNDKSALLGQLRIDRNANPTPQRPRWLWPVLIAAGLVAVLAAWLLLRPSPLLVQTATVRAMPAGGGASASVLDASG